VNYTIDAACFNNVKDNNETDVDCGGDTCYPCKPTQTCLVATDCYTNSCDNTSTPRVCNGTGYFQNGGPVSQRCKCNKGYSGSNCGVAPLVTQNVAVLASSLSAVAIVGIVIAIVLCAGVAGGGSYAVYTKQKDDNEAPVMSNPLYRGDGHAGTNPIFKGY